METFHVIVGPTIGILITILAFSDERVIRNKAATFFSGRGVNRELAGAIERMIAGAIALATFLGNAYILGINFVIVLTIFPHSYLYWNVSILALATLVVGGQIVWMLRFGLMDIAELAPIGRWTLDRCLLWEQVLMNIITVAYFLIGLHLAGHL